MKALTGTGVAIVTPFNKDYSIDFDGLSNLVNHLIDGKVEYLVVLGTTGETATLSQDEQDQVLAHVKLVNKGRVPLVLGIGGNNTAEMIARFQHFNTEGVSAILTASPYYNKPTQEGIYQHYKSLAANFDLPILLYNVPGRTASNMTAETTLRLANDIDTIIGIKEASANMDQVMQIIDKAPSDFFLTSGEDALAFPITTLGGAGVISVVANAYPLQFSNMIRAAKEGRVEEAKKLHYQLLDFTNMLFEEGNPGGIKVALEIMGICGATMRQPLWPISENLKARIKTKIEQIG